MSGEEDFKTLDHEYPLALLPVRLEVRFFEHEGDKVFGVRVFPDTIHADDHRELLTRREYAAGLRYWRSIWADGKGAPDEPTENVTTPAEAQRWLSDQVGAYRAVYVAQVTTPTNAGKQSMPPEFPEPALQGDNDAAEPVVARLLPDGWLLRIYGASGKVEYEQFLDIPDPDLVMAPSLAGGFDTSKGTTDERGTARGFLEDQNLKWMIDFDAAIDAGMAFRIDRDDLPSQIRTLLVTGVRSGRRVIDEAEAMFGQFAAHRFSRGLDIAPQGTPTNNSDAGRSGFSLDAPDTDAIFEAAARPGPGLKRALGEALIKSPASLYLAQGADSVSVALGRVAPNAFDWTANARVADGAAAWAMNVATAYSTIGSFLGGPLLEAAGGIPYDAGSAIALRDHLAQWVRGGAALPTIRCGEQPYGLMPISSRLTKPGKVTDFDTGLRDYLAQLLDIWRAALPAATLDPDATDGRPAASPADGVSDVASVLGAVPHPTALQLRDANNDGPRNKDSLNFFIDNVADLLTGGPNSSPTSAAQIASSDAALAVWEQYRPKIDSRGPTNNPTIDEQVSNAEAFLTELYDLEDQYPAIDDWIRSTQHSVDGQMLELLRERQAMTDQLPSILDPLHDRGGVGSRDTLRLAATVFELDAMSLDDLVGVEEDASELLAFWRWFGAARREAEQLLADNALEKRSAQADESSLLVHLLDISYRTVPANLLPVFGAAVNILNNITRLADTVYGTDPDQDPGWVGDPPPYVVGNPFGGRVYSYAEVTEILERLLRESIGLSMYRLDAWILSLANKQFAEVRKQAPYGIQIGAYGWLVDIEASDEPASQGFIHAPSLNHATTAAVLRSGWSAFGTASGDAPLSVDLSSDRVRQAQWILDGLRNGQDLAEVLGARFERRLHDARLDDLISTVRQIVLDVDGDSTPPQAIVDGLVVARAAGGALSQRTARESAVAEALGLQRTTAATPEERRKWTQLRAAAREVNADLDSVADVVMFQSVHSLLQGDSPSAEAALAISSGMDASIPQITATASQRDAQLIGHRIVALTADKAISRTGQPLHDVSPGVVEWIEGTLPVPERVLVSWVLDSGKRADTSLADLGLEAATAAMLAGDGPTQDGSDLGRVVTALLAARFGPGGAADLARADDDPDIVNVDEFGLIAARLADALGRARALAPADLVLPDTDVADATYGIAELGDRLARARDALDSIRSTLQGVRPTGKPSALATAVALGIPGALVALETGSDRTGVIEALTARIDVAPTTTTGTTGSAADAEVLAAALSELTGGALPITTPFTPVVDLAPAMIDTVTAETAGWFRQVGYVRTSTGAIAETLLLAGAIADSVEMAGVLQLPVAAGPWVANTRPSRRGDHLSILSVNGVDNAANASISGLLFDSWTESIPRKDQATGVAVHFDSPSARPPQTILLSTATKSQPFSADEVCDQLLWTLELAKIRAVDPAKVDLGQLFPAIYLPGDIDTADDKQAREAAP